MSLWLDEPLRGELDPAAAHALSAWCSQTAISLRLVRRLTGGRSAALVAAVLEDGPQGGRQLVMKLDRAPGSTDDPEPGEYAQHARALADAPAFAGQHLTQPVHQPVSVGDGRWFAFQRVAGGGLRDPITLHTLLDAVLHPPRPSRGSPARSAGPRPLFPSPRPGAAAFAEASAAITRSVLDGWAGRAQVPSMGVPDILRSQLGQRLAPGGARARAADAHRGCTITVEDEDGPLPNPFALILDTDRHGGLALPTFVGRAHGDLHVENVLVPASLHDVAASFQLIDLSRYRPDAVLTWDPTHLVLHVLARTLVDLSPAQRDATIDLLLDPDLDGDLVPLWLSSFVGAVRTAGEDWARQADLVDQWRDQVPLSLLAGALACHVRASTRPQDRAWFLRLAANAAAAILDQHAPPPAAAGTRRTGGDQDAGQPGGAAASARSGWSADRIADDGNAEHGNAEHGNAEHGNANGAQPSRQHTDDGAAPAGHRDSREVRGRADAPAHAGAPPTVATGRGSARTPAAGDAELVVSYAAADRPWAAWISWHLASAGWRVGTLEPAAPPAGPRPRPAPAGGSPYLLVVLSPTYLDPGPATAGTGGRPSFAVRVEPCEPPDWLTGVDTVDLVGLGENEARAALVNRLAPPSRAR
ncbi:toll/interleukin-1 receptor domain-containing protein [Frankia sp. AgB32]|uniref:toll/interleukin-1 receptor domain-containing protein n=1 Tax=Frankia sp. AgB32 TaxID=631119 RepID=UPI00200C85A0|nr:toll/interleukin-1 receptor domain-containing protein [Frankia sp. AgB32]MCK9894142.1 toll/interleukin-1 receptor domain-containing protein [Frankia sp. AgB32]